MEAPITTIKQDWESFLAHSFPEPISREQRETMRDCFYAGYHASLCLAKRLGEPEVTEEDAMRILTAVDAEMGRFLDQIVARLGNHAR